MVGGLCFLTKSLRQPKADVLRPVVKETEAPRAGVPPLRAARGKVLGIELQSTWLPLPHSLHGAVMIHAGGPTQVQAREGGCINYHSAFPFLCLFFWGGGSGQLSGQRSCSLHPGGDSGEDDGEQVPLTQGLVALAKGRSNSRRRSPGVAGPEVSVRGRGRAGISVRSLAFIKTNSDADYFVSV